MQGDFNTETHGNLHTAPAGSSHSECPVRWNPKKIRDKIFFFAIIYLTWTQGFESTFVNKALFTSGQLPNSLGAPQVVGHPRRFSTAIVLV